MTDFGKGTTGKVSMLDLRGPGGGTTTAAAAAVANFADGVRPGFAKHSATTEGRSRSSKMSLRSVTLSGRENRAELRERP